MTTITDPDRYLYASRMLRLLDKPDEAMALLDEAIEQHPDDATLLRWRGHGHITAGDFAAAEADLQRAADLIAGTEDEHEFYTPQVIPEFVALMLGRTDGMRDPHLPVNDETNEQTKGLYKSTLHGSIWYHLALSQYLQGNFETALENYGKAKETSLDDDLDVAVLDWTYMILRRLGREEDAAALIEDVDISALVSASSDDFYFRRMKLYKGEITPEELLDLSSDSPYGATTQGYGVGNWYLYNGDKDKAKEVFANIVETGNPKAFAYIAARADLARL